MRNGITASVLLARADHDRVRPPTVPVAAGYHEYAYVTNGKSNSVSVIDLLELRNVKTIAVGTSPTGLAASPTRNEIYVANTDSNNISIIDAERGEVAGAIGVHRAPYFVSVSPDGKRAYVANSGSANVSVIDLAKRVVIAPSASAARRAWRESRQTASWWWSAIAPITRISSSIPRSSRCRRHFAGLPAAAGPGNLAGLQQGVRRLPGIEPGGVGRSEDRSIAGPTWTWASCRCTSTLKPDGGELFVSNFNSNNFSIIETGNNEVGGTYLIGNNPSRGMVTSDNSLLYMSNFGSDTVSVYAIDEGRVIGAVQVGSHPDALALTPDEAHLLVVDSRLGRRRGGAHSKDARQFEDQRRPRAGHADPGRQSAERHRD